MERHNYTQHVDFILLGFVNFPGLNFYFVLFFALSYVFTLIANLFLITLIHVSPSLKSPMYFFLSNLAFLDMTYTSVTSPKLISISVTSYSIITLSECTTQNTFFVIFTSIEYFLLTVMSYDRYVAVCRPLSYRVLLNERFCKISSLSIWLLGFSSPILTSLTVSQNLYCASNVINHFFCNLATLLELSCTDTIAIQTFIFGGVVIFMPCFLATVISYVFIISTVIKIKTSAGKHKAFSTCLSHLTTVILFYSVIFLLFMTPRSAVTQDQRKLISIVYCIVIPMLNPLIYSLRNKDVKNACWRIIKHNRFVQFIR